MIRSKLNRLATVKIVSGDRGFILIATLTLLSVLTLVGSTAFILSSTDIRVGGIFRNNRVVLQVAMAGAERARERLRVENIASGNPGSLSDELNSATRKGANGLLDGYSATTDDVALASGTMNGVSYVVYLTNDTAEGISNTTDANGKVLITSVATGPGNSKAEVQVETGVNGPPTSPAVIYSKGDVTGNGAALTINGNDGCGAQSAVAPIYTKDPATSTLHGNPSLSGSPSTPQNGPLDIDVGALGESLKKVATVTVTQDLNGVNIGSATNYVTVYSDTNNPVNNQGLTLQNLTGYGTLVVKGDLELGGGFKWYGLIVVTGELKLNGGGGPNAVNISGKIITGTSPATDVDVNGGNLLNYNSCDLAKAMAANPLRVVNWRQKF